MSSYTSIDTLRAGVSSTQVSLRAAGFRQINAQATFDAAQSTFKAALANMKADNNLETKGAADKAMTAMKAAKDALSAAEEELATRKTEADAAKKVYNESHAARSRRQNKFGDVSTRNIANLSESSDVGLCPLPIGSWRADARATLADYTTMSEFPSPPSAYCGKPSCIKNKDNRALAACPCNIQQCFEDQNTKGLNTWKNLFHADRFEKCSDSIKADCKAKAKEVYAVLNRMYQDSNGTGGSKSNKNFQQASRNRKAWMNQK